jgi:hypothetical protein
MTKVIHKASSKYQRTKIGGAKPAGAYNKVFGIGLSRSGTTSLNVALNSLGIKSLHYGIGTKGGKEMIGDIKHGKFDGHQVMDSFDAMTDIQASCYFEQWDKVYPNSKFILTIRNTDEWIDSIRRYWKVHDDERNYLSQQNGFMHTSMYGCWHFNKRRFLYVYLRHLREVKRYFKNKEHQLLIINFSEFSDKKKWKKLCSFLGLPMPYSKNGKLKRFPHSNVNHEVPVGE